MTAYWRGNSSGKEQGKRARRKKGVMVETSECFDEYVLL